MRAGNTQNPNTFALSTSTYALNNYQLQSSVTAFNFFSIRNSIEANRFSWQAALANSDKTKNDISLNVANAYLQVLLAIEQTAIAESQMHLSQNQLEITIKQVRAGALPELNAAELEAQTAQDSATYINAKGTITQDILQLKAYMGMDASVPFDVYTPPVEDIPVGIPLSIPLLPLSPCLPCMPRVLPPAFTRTMYNTRCLRRSISTS
jgi:outer membrane protein